LDDGSFSIDFFVSLNERVDLFDLFPDDETEVNSTKFNFTGTLQSRFPVEVLFRSNNSLTPLLSTASPTTQPTSSEAPSLSTSPTLSTSPSSHPSSLPSIQPTTSSDPSSVPSSQPSTSPPRFGVVLIISDDDLFSSPIPTVEYEFDICPIVKAIKASIQGLADDLITTVTDELNAIAPDSLTIDLDKITGK